MIKRELREDQSIHDGQEGTVHPTTDRVDAVRLVEFTIAHDENRIYRIEHT
jgi:hypothetical protein